MNKPQIDKIQLASRKILGSVQGVVEARMNCKDAETIRVLAASADAQINSHECLAGEASFNGRVNVKAIVSDNDDNVASLNYNVDYSDRFASADISPDAKLEFVPFVIDISYEINGNTLIAKCVLETKIYSDKKSEIELMTVCEGINCKTEYATMAENTANLNHTFSVVDEIELKHKIGKILLAESNAVATSFKCGQGVMTIKGDIFTCVTYQTSDKVIKSTILQTPFSEEMDAKGVNESTVVSADTSVRNTKLHLEIVEDEDNRTFTLENEICVKVKCFSQTEKQITIDAFCLTEEIKLVPASFENSHPQNYFCYTQKVDSVLDMENKAKVDEILCTTNPKVLIVRCNAVKGDLTVEGIVSGNLLYLSEEKVSSSDFEVPFVFSLDCDNANAEYIICNAVVTELNAKVVRGSISLDAGIKFGFNSQSSENISAVKDIEFLGAKPTNGCAIEVLTGKKGMSLWDLQKYLNMPESEITACNPDLCLPLENDKKVLVYRQLKD